MDINEEIQREIDMNDGSETCVIARTVELCKYSETRVRESIEWLNKNGFVEVVDPKKMSESEKMRFRSDRCRILRNVSTFDIEKYLDKRAIEQEAIDTLPNIDKFKHYVSKMEEEFKKGHIFNGTNYALSYKGNAVTISFEDRPDAVIDFGSTSNWDYDETSDSIFYKQGDEY